MNECWIRVVVESACEKSQPVSCCTLKCSPPLDQTPLTHWSMTPWQVGITTISWKVFPKAGGTNMVDVLSGLIF